MQHSPFISNSREIIHSKCNSRLSVPRVCDQVKKLLSLMLLFFLTVTKKKECLSGHHLSPLLVWTHHPALCQKSHVTLGTTPWGLWLPRTAELASHPPAQLGDIIIYFISNFFLYIFFFLFHLRAHSRADWTVLVPEAVQATGNQWVGWGAKVFPWN